MQGPQDRYRHVDEDGDVRRDGGEEEDDVAEGPYC